jgi:hypothetical protein
LALKKEKKTGASRVFILEGRDEIDNLISKMDNGFALITLSCALAKLNAKTAAAVKIIFFIICFYLKLV